MFYLVWSPNWAQVNFVQVTSETQVAELAEENPDHIYFMGSMS